MRGVEKPMPVVGLAWEKRVKKRKHTAWVEPDNVVAGPNESAEVGFELKEILHARASRSAYDMAVTYEH